MKRLVVLAALAGGVLFVLPSTAAAQIPAESWANDRCDDQSGATGNGPYRTSDQFNNLSVSVSGSGSVAAAMHGTGAQECLNPMGAVCPPSCAMTISTVCEFHCYHDHTAPFPWWVKLEPTGANFLGWTPASACSWGKAIARNWCVVRMLTDQTVTATFGAAPDTQPPSAPSLSAQPVGPFSVNLTWTPSSDAWLAGYDVYQGSTLVDRVGPGTTSYKIENLRCQTSYSFRVEAFDSGGNAGSSAAVSARTGACVGSGPSGTVPNTVIHVKPPRVTRSRAAFFHFGTRAASVAAARYQCKLDRGRWRACSGRLGKRYRNLRRGYHTFQVRAGNANGFDRTPSRWRWRIR
ncbi:MAG TPA: fibronectin type III domain-containing protein [Gaiellaceae bacterium]|nr:fibronectin type III domain-containing protein [Gaiellaceae bacterium]